MLDFFHFATYTDVLDLAQNEMGELKLISAPLDLADVLRSFGDFTIEFPLSKISIDSS